MPEGVVDAIESAPKAAGNFLTHKLGPLPVWGWGLLVGAGVGGYLYYKNSRGSGGLSPGVLNALGVGSPAGYSGSGGSTGSTLTTSLPSLLTNNQWMQSVLNGAASAAGISLQQAQMYLNDYLNGTAPNLSGQNETAYQALINAAIALGGQAPQAIAGNNNNSNPFTSMTSWLNEIIAFLPSGGMGGESQAQIASALTNLINGVSTDLTQAEADALASAQSVVGSGPIPLSFTIGQAAKDAAAAAAKKFTQAMMDAWGKSYGSGQQTYQSWIASAPNAVTSQVTSPILAQIYAYFNTAAGQTSVRNAGGALNWWNSYIANPYAIPGAK